jgi:hypothetical protein
MVMDLPESLAVHGIRLRCPSGWEIAGVYGGWRRGQLILSFQRQAILGVNWQRGRSAPDLPRSLRTIGRNIAKAERAQGEFSSQALGSDGLIGTWKFANGTCLLAAARDFRRSETTLLLRQLAPFADLADIALAAETCGDSEATPWSMHGLAVTLPPWWRLEGMQHLAGLTRAVWCHYPNGRMRPDQVLVLRRLALASTLLAGKGPEAWIRSHLRRRETATTVSATAASCHLVCRQPARNWLRRLFGRIDERHIHAVVEHGSDRLVIQEWKGDGQALGCLLNDRDGPQGGALAVRSAP